MLQTVLKSDLKSLKRARINRYSVSRNTTAHANDSRLTHIRPWPTILIVKRHGADIDTFPANNTRKKYDKKYYCLFIQVYTCMPE